LRSKISEIGTPKEILFGGASRQMTALGFLHHSS